MNEKGLWVLILYEVIDEKFTIHMHIYHLYLVKLYYESVWYCGCFCGCGFKKAV
jgi:hypothetical protein